MPEDDDLEQIIKAISSSEFRWRTVRGIAKDTGLEEPKIVKVLDQSENFIRARKPNAAGDALYTTRDKYAKETSLSTRLLSAITNKINA
jgi:hypothetical protein